MVALNASLSIPSAKVLCATLKCLSRFDEEVEILPEPDKISFASLNRSKSAYGCVAFKRQFFDSYKLEEPIPENAPILYRHRENGRWSGRIQVKLLFDRLKHLTFSQNVRTIALIIEDEPGHTPGEGEDRYTGYMRVTFECPYDVMVVHHMSLSTSDEEPLVPRMHEEPSKTITIGPVASDRFASLLRRTESRPKGLVFCTLDPEMLTILGKPGKNIIAEEIRAHAEDLPRYNVGGTTTSFKLHAREFSPLEPVFSYIHNDDALKIDDEADDILSFDEQFSPSQRIGRKKFMPLFED
ncbi:hypothetical protein CALCODRAFT_480222 [Calocera cornea HHB12733]|uniref:DNA repair protein rad9 n=1 Tax=Calocera cornea HHB12733 TaxID=1353952 RepID=A0A165IW75_9BASI|nr:hypothetical protein CALCODRAFT_480222 [Calocera cornea HHB12733]